MGISWLAMRNREVRHVLLPVGGPWIPPLNCSANVIEKEKYERGA